MGGPTQNPGSDAGVHPYPGGGGGIYGPGHGVQRVVVSQRKTKTKDLYGRNRSSVFRRKCAELKAKPEGRICVLCQGEIDVSMPPQMYNDPGYWTAQHDPPLSAGGDLIKDLIGGAHRGCNSAEGRAMQLQRADGWIHETSRQW